MAKLTKKAKSLAHLDAEKLYGVDEALKTIKELATAKFDETIEVALNLGVDPRHADQMVRGMVSLPAGTGKEMKVAVFARGDKADAATAAGADKVARPKNCSSRICSILPKTFTARPSKLSSTRSSVAKRSLRIWMR